MNKTASADATITLRADAGAVFSNLTLTPNALGAGGGRVAVSATITDPGIGITQASVVVLKNGAAYATLILTSDASGVYSAALTLPADNLPAPNVWTFRLGAVSAAKVATTAADLTLNQKGRNLSSVSGVVTLEGSVRPAQSVTMNFRSTDNGVSQARAVPLGADGGFSLTDIPQGTYNVAIKGAKWLQIVQPIDTTTTDATGLKALLLAGDANNDNFVDTGDFGLLVGTYGSRADRPGSGYDPTCDFNDDGVIDTTDFGLLVGNYGTQGAP